MKSSVYQFPYLSTYFLKKIGYKESFMPFDVECPQKGRIYTNNIGSGFYYIGCSGIKRHKDGAFLPPYIAFLVVRNDGFIAKPYHRSAKNRNQPRGSLILLNIHKYHHVMRLPNRNEKSLRHRWWISLAKDYNRKPTNEQIIKDFDYLIKRH